MISALLIAALIHVESRGNDHAINYREQSYGCLQVGPGARQDFERLTGRKIREIDCFNRDLSIQIFTTYVTHYCTAERLGHAPTDADYARVWNGGPNGFRRPVTLTYWAKVQRELLRLGAG